MLYTFAHAQYDTAELHALLTALNHHDVIVLWQDGVLLGKKQPQLFVHRTVFALAQDVEARHLPDYPLPTISLAELVKITEQHAPHAAF